MNCQGLFTQPRQYSTFGSAENYWASILEVDHLLGLLGYLKSISTNSEKKLLNILNIENSVLSIDLFQSIILPLTFNCKTVKPRKDPDDHRPDDKKTSQFVCKTFRLTCQKISIVRHCLL